MPSEVQQITRVLIWSLERQQWWLPGGNEYTDDVNQAGQYWIVDALDILKWANLVKVCETMVPVNTLGPDVQAKLRAVP